MPSYESAIDTSGQDNGASIDVSSEGSTRSQRAAGDWTFGGMVGLVQQAGLRRRATPGSIARDPLAVRVHLRMRFLVWTRGSRSEGPQPHLVNIEFRKRMKICVSHSLPSSMQLREARRPANLDLRRHHPRRLVHPPEAQHPCWLPLCRPPRGLPPLSPLAV
jgi:hypothetical protein